MLSILFNKRSINFETLCQESDAEAAQFERLKQNEKWTGKVLSKSELLQQLFRFGGINVHPDALENGTQRHNLLKTYLEGRQKGLNSDDAFGLIAFPDNKPAAKRTYFWAATPEVDSQTDATKVARAAERFIELEKKNWSKVKFGQRRSAKINSFLGKPAGGLSYGYDLLVGSTPYEVKFSDKLYPPDLAEITIALMALTIREGTLNHTKLPYSPKGCLIFPQGPQTANFAHEGVEVKDKILTACLQLLSADFSHPGKVGEAKKGRQEVTSWQRQLF